MTARPGLHCVVKISFNKLLERAATHSLIMDIKNLTYDLLGITLRLKLPGFWRQEEQEGAEYQLKIEESQEHKENQEEEEREERKVSYIEWRYGERLKEIVTARPHTEPASQKASQDKLKRLRKDFRVINNYLTPQQIAHIETWLQEQPEHFQAEEIDGHDVEPVRERNRNVCYRKVSIV